MKKKTSKRTAEYWIKRLRLRPHPEGGYYRETYRAPEMIAKADLPRRYNGRRALATAIYFLLRGDQCSAFHRLKSDEIWHFYDGSPLFIFVIGNDGRLTTAKLGLNAEEGEQPQFVIRAGAWFAAALANPKSTASPQSGKRPLGPCGNGADVENPQPQSGPPVAEKLYVLIGCTVAPGFDFADFELGNRGKLCRKFPKHRALIVKLTKAGNHTCTS